MSTSNEPRYFSDNWNGLEWSPWIPFESDTNKWKLLPDGKGLYRVRSKSTSSIVYIGQSGRNLRTRLRRLYRQVNAREMPYNDPHTAAPCLWTYKLEERLEYECSAAIANFDKKQRLCIESELLWKYRSVSGTSPIANFGNMHAHYTKSKSKKSGIRGQRLDVPKKGGGLPALEFHSEPAKNDWMKLDWSLHNSLTRNEINDVKIVPGVYRIMSLDEVVYIGQSSVLRNRLLQHLDFGSKHNFSYAIFAGANRKELLEIENDLIGAYYYCKGCAPKAQFNAGKSL